MALGSKWYRVIGESGLTASTTTPGIREAGQFAKPGTILPREWFKDVDDDVCELFLLPVSEEAGGGFGCLEPYEPNGAELEALLMQYPVLRPAAKEIPAKKTTSRRKKKTDE